MGKRNHMALLSKKYKRKRLELLDILNTERQLAVRSPVPRVALSFLASSLSSSQYRLKAGKRGSLGRGKISLFLQMVAWVRAKALYLMTQADRAAQEPAGRGPGQELAPLAASKGLMRV